MWAQWINEYIKRGWIVKIEVNQPIEMMAKKYKMYDLMRIVQMISYKKVLGVYTRSMETIYLSLVAEVPVSWNPQ